MLAQEYGGLTCDITYVINPATDVSEPMRLQVLAGYNFSKLTRLQRL